MLDPFIDDLSRHIFELYNKDGTLNEKQKALESELAYLEEKFLGEVEPKPKVQDMSVSELYEEASNLIKGKKYKEGMKDSDFATLNHALFLLSLAVLKQGHNNNQSKEMDLLVSLRNQYVRHINRSFIGYYRCCFVHKNADFEAQFVEDYLEDQTAFSKPDDIDRFKGFFKLVYKFCQQDTSIEFKDESRLPTSLSAIMWHLLISNQLTFEDFETFLDNVDPLSSYHKGRHQHKHFTNSVYTLVQGYLSIVTRMKGYIHAQGYDNLSPLISLPESVIYKLALCFIQGTYVKKDVVLGSMLMRYAAIAGYPLAIVYDSLAFRELFGVDEGVTNFILINSLKRAYDLFTSEKKQIDVEKTIKVGKKVIDVEDYLLLNLITSVANFCDYAKVNGFEYEDKFLPLRYKVYFQKALDKVVYENKLEFTGFLARIAMEAGDLFTLFNLGDYKEIIDNNDIVTMDDNSIYTEACNDFLFYYLDKAIEKNDTYAKLIAIKYYDNYMRGFSKSKLELLQDLTDEDFSFAAEILSDHYHIQKQSVQDYDFEPELLSSDAKLYKKCKTTDEKYDFLDNLEKETLDKADALGSINAFFSKLLKCFDVFRNASASHIVKSIGTLNKEEFGYKHFLFLRSIPESYSVLHILIKEKKLANTIIKVGSKLGLDKCMSLLQVENPKERECLPFFNVLNHIIESSKTDAYLSWFVAECYNEGIMLPQSKVNAKFFAMQSLRIKKNQKALNLILKLNREFYKNDYNMYASRTNLYAHYLSFVLDEVDDIYDDIESDVVISKNAANMLLKMLEELEKGKTLYEKILLGSLVSMDFMHTALLDIEERNFQNNQDESVCATLMRLNNAKYHYNSNYIINAYLGNYDYFLLDKGSPTNAFMEVERNLSDIQETILGQSKRLVSPWSSTYKDYVSSYKIILNSMHTRYYQCLRILSEEDKELIYDPTYLFTRYKVALSSTINKPNLKIAKRFLKEAYNHNSGFATLFMFLDLDALDYVIPLTRKTIKKKKIQENSDSISSGTLTYEIKQ